MNNRGWGLRVMLAICLVLALALLIAAAIYNSNFNKTDGIEFKGSNTQKLESKLRRAAINYITDKKIKKNNDFVIGSEVLIEEGFLDNLTDKTNSECTGYVLYKKSKNKTEPFISCKGGYKTSGYSENYR